MKIQSQTNKAPYFINQLKNNGMGDNPGQEVSVTAPLTLFDDTAASVTISVEGRDSYRENAVIKENMERNKVIEESQSLDILSKNQVMDLEGWMRADFHKRFAGLNTETLLGSEPTFEGFEKNLSSIYDEMYNEITKGYEEGTREIYSGQHKVTQDEEVSALKEALDFWTQAADAYIDQLPQIRKAEEYERKFQEYLEELRNNRKKYAENQSNVVELERIRRKLDTLF